MGRKADIEKVLSVATASIQISDLIEKKKVSVPVSVRPDGVKVESIDPMQVTVSILNKVGEQ